MKKMVRGTEIRKLWKFEAAHQLSDAYTKECYETIHGHSYKVEVFLQSARLNGAGMVMDFGQLNEAKEMIIGEMDHALFIPDGFDRLYVSALMKWNKKVILTPENPTAEYFARYIYDSLLAFRLDGPVFVQISQVLSRVRVHETDTGYAEYPVYMIQETEDAQSV